MASPYFLHTCAENLELHITSTMPSPGMLLSSSPIPEHDNTRCIHVTLDDQDFAWAMQSIDFELDFATDTPDESLSEPTTGARSQRCGSGRKRRAASAVLGLYHKCRSISGFEPKIHRSAQHAATIVAFFCAVNPKC